MNAALFLIIGVVVLIVGYIFYGGWLAKKWGVDNSRVTPAHELEDGKDYCPAKAPVPVSYTHLGAPAAFPPPAAGTGQRFRPPPAAAGRHPDMHSRTGMPPPGACLLYTSHKNKKRIVLANAHDEPALSAVVNAHRRGVVDGTLLGKKDEILALLQEIDVYKRQADKSPSSGAER